MAFRGNKKLDTTISFGREMRFAHFNFDPKYTPLNHGSYGAFPKVVRDRQRELQDLIEARPDPYIRHKLPKLLGEARTAVAPLLGVSVDEVVFVPNATTAVNTVLRNLAYEDGDVILYFSTAYGACQKTVNYICEITLAQSVCVELQYPVEDAEVVQKFCDTASEMKSGGRRIKIALLDTVIAFPGVRMPWEALVKACKDLGVLSLIDGAHGIGHIDLKHLGRVGPDFFTSNCYKWLYVPRGCAVFHVPARNQHLIRTSLPTSHGFRPSSNADPQAPLPSFAKNLFVELFAWVATIDTTPYACIPEALQFRETVCGGEEIIRRYCQDIVQSGAKRMASILGTEVMTNKTDTLESCCFANVRLPLTCRSQQASYHSCSTKDTAQPDSQVEDKSIAVIEAPKIAKWIMERAVMDFDTHIPTKYHAGDIWVRLSGQVYLETEDFEWAGHMLKDLCERVLKGEFRS